LLSHAAITMTAASSNSPKRPFDSSLADPSLPAKLQRTSGPDPAPAGNSDGASGGGEAAAEESKAMAGVRNPRAQRYLVAVEYVGTRFSGSQQQPNQRTVVGVLEVRCFFSLSSEIRMVTSVQVVVDHRYYVRVCICRLGNYSDPNVN
jgi:hypothetical protein